MKRILLWVTLAVGLGACTPSQDTDSLKGETLFQLLDPLQTGVDFVNHLQETEELNIIQYLYFYNGAGVAIGDINNDGLADLVFTSNQGPDRLYLNEGDFRFKDITLAANMGNHSSWSTGVTMADVNGDGWLDIYICEVGGYKSLNGRNRLYINQQDLTFKESAEDYGLSFQGLATQAAFFDYDQDGDLDMYLLCHSTHSPENYRPAEMREVPDALAGDRLFLNDQGIFRDISQQAGIYSSKIGYGLGLSIGDLNQDGFPDIYVGNDFHEQDYLYLNNGNGTFSESIEQTMSYISQFSMGNEIADVNNDGLLDIFTLDMKPHDTEILKRSVGSDAYDVFQFKVGYGYHYQYPRNMLQLNRGTHFTEVAQMAGIDATDWSWSALFADLDNDGWKDLFVTNGISRRPNDLDYLKFLSNPAASAESTDEDLWTLMPEGKVSNCAFQNQQGEGFKKTAEEWGLDQEGLSQGASYADLDNDGDLDLVVNNINEGAAIYQNQGSPANYLQILPRLTTGNTFAYGTLAWVYTGGIVQTQYLQPTRGFMSAVDPIMHFGLGDNQKVDSLILKWPGGDQEIWYDLKANQRLRLLPGEGQQIEFDDPTTDRWFSPFNNEDLPRYLENEYLDINQEKLIPHQWSHQGPVMAAADIDGDGLQEIYLGGAKDQLPFLLNSQGDRQPVQKFLVEGISYEDTGVNFFDANQDGHTDLYIASGGNEHPPGHPLLRDRLYLNNGSGEMYPAPALPQELAQNTGPVASCDFDKDGDMDLFVGVQVIQGHYGQQPNSYILENDGQGNFKIISEPVIKGMITAASWTDIDGDGREDLVIAGEWMPITVYFNRDQGFEKMEVPHSAGWWRCMTVADMDKDGDMDLILGNHGLNSFIKADSTNPLRLYVNDFDKNGSTDPIITYQQKGQEHTLATKDQLEQQLTFIRKRFPSYQDFATTDFKDILPLNQFPQTEIREVQQLGSVFLENKGGTFKVHLLPMAAQLAPIHSLLTGDFNEDGHLDILAAGNFYPSQISIGRLDASSGLVLSGDGQGQFQALSSTESGLLLKGEVRNMIITADGSGKRVLMAARNQDTPQMFILNEKP